MKRTAWFLILIGAVTRIRGCVVLFGGMDIAAKVKVPGQSSDESMMTQMELFSHAVQAGAASLGVGDLILGLGILLLLAHYIWKTVNGRSQGLKALENRQRKSLRYRR